MLKNKKSISQNVRNALIRVLTAYMYKNEPTTEYLNNLIDEKFVDIKCKYLELANIKLNTYPYADLTIRCCINPNGTFNIQEITNLGPKYCNVFESINESEFINYLNDLVFLNGYHSDFKTEELFNNYNKNINKKLTDLSTYILDDNDKLFNLIDDTHKIFSAVLEFRMKNGLSNHIHGSLSALLNQSKNLINANGTVLIWKLVDENITKNFECIAFPDDLRIEWIHEDKKRDTIEVINKRIFNSLDEMINYIKKSSIIAMFNLWL